MTMLVEVLEPEVVGAQLAEVEKSAGLNEDAALALRDQFGAYYTDIAAWREKAAMVTKPDDPTHQKIARDVRLGLRRIRCDVETMRKALKADSLARGKAIDGFANVLKYLCEPIEDQLLAVEQYAERQEAVRIAALAAERAALILAEGADPGVYNLGIMDDATFSAVLAGAKKSKADRDEAERKEQADRVAKEQADRIAREQAEADAAAARKEAEKERKAREATEAKAKAEREAIEAKAAAERAAAETKAKAAKDAADAAFAKEREAREKIEREAAAAKAKEAARVAAEKATAEAKAKAEADAAAKAARAPDKEKIAAFAYSILNIEAPDTTTPEGASIMDSAIEKRAALVTWIANQAAKL